MSAIHTDKDGNVEGNGTSGTYVLIGCIRYYGFNTAITANTTLTSAPAGSRARTSHSTGIGKAFYSDGTKWQFEAVS